MELVRFTQILWKRLWLIGVAVVVVTGMTYALSSTTPPVYSASVILEISLGLDPSRDPYSSLRSSELVASTYVEQLSSSVILQPVIDTLGLDTSVAELQSQVSVQQLRDTQLIRVSVQDASPLRAKELADQIAQTFIRYGQAKQRSRYDTGLVELDRQTAELEAAIEETQKAIASLGDPSDPENRQMPEMVRLELARLQSTLTSQQTRYTILLGSAEDFRLAATRYSDTISVFAPAQVPRSPVGPRTTLNTVLGALSGLALGVSMAFLFEYLDDSLTTAEDVQTVVDWTVLGSIDQTSESGDLGGLLALQRPDSPPVDQYRLLRTNLRSAGPKKGSRVLLFSSTEPGVGKTTTLANLGVLFAQGGQRVVLVDANLRRPSLHTRFNLAADWGLTDVVLGEVSLDVALQETEIEGLWVLGCGQSHPVPAALVESPEMGPIFQQLRDVAEVILVDAPPVLGMADVALLSAWVDGILLVVESGKTRRDALRKAAEALATLETEVLGVVLNGCPSKAGSGRYAAGYADQGGSWTEERESDSLSQYVMTVLPSKEGRAGRNPAEREPKRLDA